MKASEHHQKGLKLVEKREFKKAVVSYSKAIDLDPGVAEYYSDRAVAYFHLDQGEDSLSDMNKAQELEPEHPYRYSSRAFIKDHLGDLDGAIEDYKFAIELDPEDAISQNNLGLLEEKKGYKMRSRKRFITADKLADGEKEQIKRGETPDRWKDDGTKGREGYSRDKKKIPVEEEPSDESGLKAYMKVIGRIFSSKEGFRDFLGFIKRGWRRKSE